MNPKLVPLNLRHYEGDPLCRAAASKRRWAYVRDAAGTAMVVILALAAIYLFAAVLDTIWPNGLVGQ